MKARFVASTLLLLPLFAPSADAQAIIELASESYVYEIEDSQNLPSATYTLKSAAHGYVPMLTFSNRKGDGPPVRRHSRERPDHSRHPCTGNQHGMPGR